MESTSLAEETEFDAWIKRHNGAPPVTAQIKLAESLCDRSSSNAQAHNHIPALFSRDSDRTSSSNPCAEFPLVSWKGVTPRWFQQVFMGTREMEMFQSFGCRMWFVRNRCITEMLRRRGVTSNGSIVDHIPKLVTNMSHSSSEDYEDGNGGGGVDGIAKEASCFISYTGEMSLSQFNELIGHESLVGKQLWMDLICVCQFSWTERKDDEMMQFKEGFMYELRERIGSIGTTALLVRRWDDMMATLGKIWVLWEIFSTASGKTVLDVLLTDSEETRFIKDVVCARGGMERIDDSISKVDANNAWSFVPEDRLMILRLMEKTDGVFNVNKTVLRCLRTWFIKKAEEFYYHLEQKGENVDLYRGALISLYMSFGDITEAVRLGREKIDSCSAKLGPDHEATLTTMSQLALTLSYDGTPSSLEEAEALLKEVLRKCEAQFGEDHDISVGAHQFLANLMNQWRRLDEAESYMRKAISSQERLHGSTHPNTITAQEELREILWEKEDTTEDEERQFKKLHEIRAELGPKHPKTLETTTALANYLELQDKLSEAERLYREVMRTMTEQLGVESPLRLTAVKSLASVLHREDKLDAAESLFREALVIEQKNLGEAHGTTLDTMNELCSVLSDKGQHEEADHLSSQCMVISEKSLGKDHHDTLAFAHNRAHWLFEQGKGEEAERLLRTVFDRHRSSLGESHPDTIRVAAHLGAMVAQLGNFDQGVSIVGEAVENATRSLEEDHSMIIYAKDILDALQKNR